MAANPLNDVGPLVGDVADLGHSTGNPFVRAVRTIDDVPPALRAAGVGQPEEPALKSPDSQPQTPPLPDPWWLPDTVANTAGVVTSLAGGTLAVTDMALPLIGGAAGMLSFKKTKETLEKPREFLQNKTIGKSGKITLYSSLMYGSGVGFSGLSGYGIARSFSQKVESLKQMYADLTGKDVKNVSTISLLTGNVPKVVAEARSHLIKEHGLRGLIQAVFLGFNIRGLRKGSLGAVTDTIVGFGPMIADQVIDPLMGESPILQVYKPFSEAFKHGQADVEAYAILVCAASPECRRMGGEKPMHNPLIRKMAEKLHAAKVTPQAILEMVEKGELKKFGDDTLVEIKAAASTPVLAPAVEPASTHWQETVTDGKKTMPVKVVGDSTRKLAEQMNALSQGATLNVPQPSK